MIYQRSFAIESRLDTLLSLIRAGSHSTPALAELLGVSVPTVSRCIRALRDRGYAIEAKRVAEGWSYRLSSEHPEGRVATSDQG
ncbi:HTH domain-containing protein [Aquisphaera giovannonii]|uniref:HTH domain-containing protein n=1 Tax=Aquisphaera giovannonii TaxID=406548 RepID=UPI0011E06673|nr:winged helix-turn-helix domain-containing protein [Aquisphaera giovannonii]